MKIRLSIFALAACLAASVNAQEKFRITVGAAVQGTEEFTIQRTADGYTATCKDALKMQGGNSVDIDHTTTYSRQWDPLTYRLNTTVAGVAQVVEAMSTDSGVKLKASAGDQGREESFAKRPRTIFVDNLNVCHQAALLKRIALHRADDGLSDAQPNAQNDWWMIVPQSLQGVVAQIAADGEADGTLNGKPVHLKKFRLKAGRVDAEFLAEASTMDLESMTVASQNLKIVREGFEPPMVKQPAKEASSSCTEREFTFASANLAIPGTLCLPLHGSAPFPVVVLVHGSGPNDRDETIGPNHTFRDLAWGLAAEGIATLRYDKRSKAFPASYKGVSVTLDNEVIDDAVAALEFAAKRKEVDPKRIFLLGHSLGGFCAPFIAARVPTIAGVILLAAPGRSLDEMVLEQATFQITQVAHKGEDDPNLKKIAESIARLRDGSMADTETFMGAPASYWREARKRTPLELAALKNLTIPVLVLQGGKDVQVRRADYDVLLNALAAKPPAMREAHWFPNENHLFQIVEGTPTGAEYAIAKPMAQEVIDIIAGWINKH